MPIRFGGMATGMDTDTLVKQLMQVHRMPVDRLKQEKQTLEWTRDAYREMNTLMSQLRDSANAIRWEYQLNARKATSDNSLVSATATSAAVSGTAKIEVMQLAESAKATSSNLINSTAVMATSTTTLTVNGVDVTIAANSKITDVVNALNNNKTATGVTAQYDSTTQRLYLTHNGTGVKSEINLTVKSGDTNLLSNIGMTVAAPKNISSNGPITATSFTGTLNINGRDITVAGADANALVAAINAETATTNVKAEYDSEKKQLRLSLSDPSGTPSSIAVSDTAGTLTSDLKLATTTFTGKNAKVKLDGDGPLEYQSNNITYRGMNLTLNRPPANTVPDANGVLYAANLTVEQDVDKTFNAIKSFVDKYNEVIDKVNKKIKEQRYRDYDPLTEEQKAEMKEKEIELWEAKAKSGLIHNDTKLRSALDKFRTFLTSPVQGLAAGTYDSLVDIGISTSKPGETSYTSYKDNGKLYIDETKLKDAIRNNPDQVVKLLTTAGTGATQEEKDKTSGIAERIYSYLNRPYGVIDSLTKLAGVEGNTEDVTSSYALKIRDLDRKISEKSSKLNEYEQRYYSQFAKLESMISRMQSQQAQMASFFGGGM
jgi:flagellar hook-associated protein 2